MALSFPAIVNGPLLSQLKAKLVALSQAATPPLNVTSFVTGDPTERWLDITPRLIAAVVSDPITQAVRGMFLGLATDPGDPGDMSFDQTPRAGFLSARGREWSDTTRREQTAATSTVTIRNDGSTSTTPFAAYDLTFTTIAPEPAKGDGGRPTYRNSTVGSTVLAPGASITLDIIAEQIGIYGNAGVNSLVCQTQSFGTLTVTASGVLVGTTREDPDLYRARCRISATKLAKGGPTQAYLYAMNTAKDGSPLQRYDDSGPVLITGAYVSPSSSTGVVTVYYWGLDGAVLPVDVDSANANILGLSLGINVDPLGILPDTATMAPKVYSGGALPDGTPGGASVTNTTIAVTYTAKIKASAVVGGATPGTYTYLSTNSPKTLAADPIALIFDAIANTLAKDILAAGGGGKDQTAGAGVIYTDDLVTDVRVSYAGLYNPILTAPAGATTAITLGHIGVLGTLTGTLVIT